MAQPGGVQPKPPTRWSKTEILNLLGTAIVAVSFGYTISTYSRSSPTLDVSAGAFARQLETLKQIEVSVNKLAAFVQTQQKQLAESQTALRAVEAKRDKTVQELDALRKVQAADPGIVEAIAIIQESFKSPINWLSHFLGYVFGIFSSLTASAVWRHYH